MNKNNNKIMPLQNFEGKVILDCIPERYPILKEVTPPYCTKMYSKLFAIYKVMVITFLFFIIYFFDSSFYVHTLEQKNKTNRTL